MSFPRYPEYKDSGVEWLGPVPAHWEVSQLKRAYQVDLGKMLQALQETSEEVLLPYLRSANIQWGRVDLADLKEMWFAPKEAAHLQLQNGDLLVCEGGDVGRCAIWHDELAACGIQNSVNRVRPRSEAASNEFLFYWMSLIKENGYVDILCNKSTIAHFTAEKVAAVPLVSPSIEEQRAIAAFLDRETAKIDALVAEQERLIELLKEKRQALVSHAVTKGLVPGVPMKDSGVEWLGEVPAHWEVVRNKVVFVEVDERSTDDTGELLTVSHITGVTRRSEKDVNMFLAETLEGYKTCARGDLVINTMWAWMGALGCSPIAGLVSPAYNVYRPRNAALVDASYIDHLCRIPSYVTAMKARSTGVWESRLRLYPTAFLDMAMVLPPAAEQRAIAAFIDAHRLKWNALTLEAEHAIGVLRERRAALISAVVTGQIDVRGTVETD